MKTLILIRHAKSSWKHPELSDFDRPLNKRGKRDAPMMAARLKERSVQPDHLMSSPAKRARRTAEHFADAFGIAHDALDIRPHLYMEGMSSAISTIQGLSDNWHTVLLVGHNPDITGLANFLSNTYVDNIPTCGVFCMKMNAVSWKEVREHSGKLLFFDGG